MPRGSNPDLDTFIDLLYPWDPQYTNLYKTVSWTIPKAGEKPLVANYAAQGIDDLTRLIENRIPRTEANVYVALGTQRLASIEKYSADGFPKAIRKITNTVSFRSIYLDIDIEKPGAYATHDDAFDALDDFITKIGLPDTTMEVNTGGGLHVYWCTKEPIPIEHWLVLARALQQAAIAYGLKFDPQVTVNPAGILRVPGSWNYKKVPRRPVYLYPLETGATRPLYDYQTLAGALSHYIGKIQPAPRVTAGGSPGTQFTQNFTAGVGGTAVPVPIEDLAINCGVFDDILQRGGKGDAEPLWNLALFAAAFTDDPHGAAHKLSQGDPRYTHAGTEKKLLEKINARANGGLGWPQCAQFQPLHVACATCPLFAQNKSPFNHVPPKNPQPQYQAPPTSSDPLMPPEYWRDSVRNNHVFTTTQDKHGNASVVDVLGYPVLDGGVEPDTGDLVIKTCIGGVDKWVSVPVGANMTPVTAAQALAVRGRGIIVMPYAHSDARNFIVTWLKHLQTLKRNVSAERYGWTEDGGFVYGDKVYRQNGVEQVFRGNSFNNEYSVAGDLQQWKDACQLIKGNAPLETILAAAFGAPLLDMITSTSIVLSCFSHESGIGKTTAMMLSLAVWGNPRSGMTALNDTKNSVVKKVSDLRHLPIYWDEMRTKKDAESVVDLIFQITQGKGKARLNRDISNAEVGSFTTMMTVASNYGLSNTVYANTESTEAGGLRLFEFRGKKLIPTMPVHHASSILKHIETNYGNAGMLYAEFLAKYRPTIKQVIKLVGDELAAKHNFDERERFWHHTMTALIAGATLAKRALLYDFDIDKLKAFLGEALQAQRGTIVTQSYSTLSHDDDVLGLIDDMLADIRGKHLVVTDRLHYGKGRHPAANLVDTDPDRLQNVWAQKGHLDGRIRLRTRPFYSWLREHNQHPDHIVEMLKKHYMVLPGKHPIGAGIPRLNSVSGDRSACIDLTPLKSPGSNPGSS